MTKRRWRLYRHKEHPEIEYYVEEFPSLISSTGEPNEWKLLTRPGPPDPDNEGCYLYDAVSIRCPRNAAHPQFDYPTIEQMPPGGLWPAQSFLELYEPVPDNAREVYQRATLIDEWPDEDWTNIENTI